MSDKSISDKAANIAEVCQKIISQNRFELFSTVPDQLITIMEDALQIVKEAEAKQPTLPRINSAEELVVGEWYWVTDKNGNSKVSGCFMLKGCFRLGIHFAEQAVDEFMVHGPIPKPEW